ncbi:MAG: divergent PAP2 family protein [Nanobdellota archaeon]
MDGTLFVIINCIIIVMLTQVVKPLINKGYGSKGFFSYGGMPSSHASLVAALCTSVFLIEGFSIVFAVSLIFSALFIRDALGLRRELQNHSLKLNKLSKKKEMDERIGHSVPEVLTGIVSGIILTIIFYLIIL